MTSSWKVSHFTSSSTSAPATATPPSRLLPHPNIASLVAFSRFTNTFGRLTYTLFTTIHLICFQPLCNRLWFIITDIYEIIANTVAFNIDFLNNFIAYILKFCIFFHFNVAVLLFNLVVPPFIELISLNLITTFIFQLHNVLFLLNCRVLFITLVFSLIHIYLRGRLLIFLVTYAFVAILCHSLQVLLALGFELLKLLLSLEVLLDEGRVSVVDLQCR